LRSAVVITVISAVIVFFITAWKLRLCYFLFCRVSASATLSCCIATLVFLVLYIDVVTWYCSIFTRNTLCVLVRWLWLAYPLVCRVAATFTATTLLC
jgi:hypothetical protein